MDIKAEAERLIEAHRGRGAGVPHMVRGIAQQAYAQGIKDFLRVIQQAAVWDEEHKGEANEVPQQTP